MHQRPPTARLLPALLLSFAASACASGPAALPVDGVADAYVHPQRQVEVEPGRRLNLHCMGEGAPTVAIATAITRLQALLDGLTIRRRRGSLEGLEVAICGDIMHSRVARSNIHLFQIMGARVRVVGPPTLMPTDVDRLGVEVHYNMKTGLKDVDIVMMLRLQTERMQGSFVPSISEYFRFFGLDHEKLKVAKPDALIMHPGPMNRGVEIDSEVADDLDRSVIHEQVEIGVAVRMACLEALIGDRRNTLGAAA